MATVDRSFLLLVTSTEIGAGEQDLGSRLAELLFGVLSQSDRIPGKIAFLNSGVFLTTEGSPIAEELKGMEEQGTEICSCTTCLTYYDRMEKLIVGRRSDMKDTVNALTSYQKVVTL